MEVHHHSHLASGETHKTRKKWTHYFWEFLMLFLAVFCGFLAENQREHMIEHQREKKYIRSLHSDLEADIQRLTDIVQLRNERALMLDSFSKLLNSKEALLHSNDLYYYNSFSTRGVAFRFTPVDGTMQQLKNAGNLRLVRKSIISDSITSYDVSVRAFMWGTQDEEDVMGTYRNIAEGIFDGVVLNSMRDDDNNVNRVTYSPMLRLSDDSKFRLNYRIHMLTVFNKTMRKEARKLLGKAHRLTELLKKEYHLHRAKEYAKSLLNDLKEDTIELQNGINHINFLIAAIDSIESIVSNNPNKTNLPGKFYYYCRLVSFSYPIDWNSSTLSQLIQSGNLRYFGNKELVNKINKYFATELNITGHGENDAVHREKVRELRNLIVDDRYYSAFAKIVFTEEVKGNRPSLFLDSLMKRQLPLQEGAVKYLPQLLNHLSDRRERFKSYIENYYPNAKIRADEIIKILIRDYHMK